jgi:hypothetical protein
MLKQRTGELTRHMVTRRGSQFEVGMDARDRFHNE